MKHILTLLFISAIAVTTTAQSFDKERMHRDLEVAENALGTILAPNSGDFPGWHMDEDDIEADYIKDYGVIFNVDHGSSRIKLYGKAKVKDHKSDMVIDMKSIAKEEQEHFVENCKMFLADYAGIIGQLNDDQLISIRRGGSGSHSGHPRIENVYFDNGTAKSKTILATGAGSSLDNELIVEVSVGQIKKLRKGNINRDAFLKSVNVVENVMSYEKDADLETLSAMFQRLYKKDLSKTYYSERAPKYSKLSNFGVIVKMKVYSSYENNNVYSMPTISKKGLSLEERNNHVMELLPQFEADFKDNMVNYGRTLKNLDSDEILMFEVNMTTCKDCNDFPRYMKFSIKKSVLHKFNRGDLTMKQAADKVNVERIVK